MGNNSGRSAHSFCCFFISPDISQSVAFELPSDIAGMQGIITTPRPKRMLSPWMWMVTGLFSMTLAYFGGVETMVFCAVLLLLPFVNILFKVGAEGLEFPDSLQSAEIVSRGEFVYEVEFIRNMNITKTDMEGISWRISKYMGTKTARKARMLYSSALLIPSLLIGATAIFLQFEIVSMIFIFGPIIFLCALAVLSLFNVPLKDAKERRYIVFYGMYKDNMVVLIPDEMYCGIEMQHPLEII